MRSVLLGAAAMLAAAACGSSLPNYDYSQEPDPRTMEFVIGVSDELRITVWQNPNLSTDARVRPDGTITMPLLGDLRAAGRTPSQLKDEITKRLRQFVIDESAVVSVAVTAINSYRFTVDGEVAQPGVKTSTDYVTVSEAVALAGGFTRFAKHDRIVIVRRARGNTYKRIPISYDAIMSGDHPEMNIVVIAGDTIHVP